MPFTRKKRSSEMGSFFGTVGLTGALTSEAQIRPSTQEQRAPVKSTLKLSPASCMKRPTIGPTDMAMLLARP